MSVLRIGASWEARDEFPQKALDFRRTFERVVRGGWPQLFRYDDTDAAFLKRAEGILVMSGWSS